MGAAGAVAVLHLAEQQVQGLVQVEAVAGGVAHRLPLGDEFTEPAESVPLLVLGIVGGQDAQLGAGLAYSRNRIR
ncbi:hypothetical protein GCM10023238_11430 [Streptomyces heliomycini]